MKNEVILIWILLFPLFTFLLNFLFGRFVNKKLIGLISSFSIFISFVLSLIAFNKLLENSQDLSFKFYDWIKFSDFVVPFSLVFDKLSGVMSLVVTGVSFLIHFYSIGYMKEDKDFKRFFSYLNLFVFFMLLLVLSENILLLFVGWEGVGLCSYLLIGFWYENIKNSIAGKKAFIVNRIGDAFFITGVLFIVYVLSSNNIGHIDFKTINSNRDIFYNTSILGYSSLSLITLLLFMGATGKSAQFPLYVWLPDAMAGPTPVSALIHAATMVTAGVYLLARLMPLYEISIFTKEFIMYIASFTMLLSAIIAIAQSDIKKILAYSTISQLGYMFLGVVSLNYSSGIFHLVTHAFFKALLFLTAGAVIHYFGGEQNIFKMGGIKNNLKSIFIVMLAGYLAISGFPFLSGYFSKDFIIENIYLTGNKVVWIISLITAFFTAFYMTRLFNIAFIRENKHSHHGHNPDLYMLLPLILLAVLSVISGFWMKDFVNFLSFENETVHLSAEVKYLPLILSIFGIFLGFYLTRKDISDKLEEKYKFLHTIVYNKFYVDEIYDFIFVKPLYFISKLAFDFIDRILVDKTLVEGTAGGFYFSGRLLTFLQSEKVKDYAIYILAGIILMFLML